MQKLDIFGEDYISQHTLQYVKQRNKDIIYRVYITDILKMLAENTGRLSQAFTQEGKAPSQRYYDLIKEEQQEEPEQTGDEIIADILAGLRKIDNKKGGEGDSD